MCTVKMGSNGIIYILTLVKIGRDIEGISRFCLSNLKGYNNGISERRDL
jgi:hypothetical protein